MMSSFTLNLKAPKQDVYGRSAYAGRSNQGKGGQGKGGASSDEDSDFSDNSEEDPTAWMKERKVQKLGRGRDASLSQEQEQKRREKFAEVETKRKEAADKAKAEMEAGAAKYVAEELKRQKEDQSFMLAACAAEQTQQTDSVQQSRQNSVCDAALNKPSAGGTNALK